MSRQPLWRHPERLRPGLALLFFVGFAFLFAAGWPLASKATRGPQEPGATKKSSKPEFVPGEILVRYESEAAAKQQTRLSTEAALTAQSVEGRSIAVSLERFEGSAIVPGLRLARVAAQETMAAIEALRRQPNVVYAEPNYVLYLDLNPNDPRFVSNELYGLNKIAAPQAWDTTQGSSAVVVGVIDEGIDIVHQDLQANVWVNPAETLNGADDDGNGFIDDINGYNFAGETATIPADFHGTHVGGTIGAVGNNGIGVVGVNWNVRLMSLKFIAGGTGSTADAIRACNYAKQMRDSWVSSGGTEGANLRVLNNSYGGGGFSQSFLDAINSLNQSSILFVASAGNVTAGASEPNNDIIPHYPSSYVAPNVIGVANTDSGDGLAGSSHYGLTTIHLGAPGQGILSTTPTNNYGFSSGTSMATPHVAGAAALMLAQNPNLTVQQLKALLIYNGDSAAALLNKTVTGRRLNVFKSFQALAENDTTPPGTVTNFQVNTQTGRSFNLGWTASGDDGALGQASLYQLTFTDATTSAVFPLTNIVPAASGVIQALNVKIPYRHTAGTIHLREFDNVGNEGTPASLVVSVPAELGDPYLTSLSSPVALSTGGTPLVLIGDDKLRLNHALPFAFPFFGENFSTVNVSTNGNLFFSAPPTRANGDADDVPSSVVDLAKHKMISGLWDDLRTDRAFGDDVYVISDANHIIFRWEGVTFGDGTPATEFPVNFEVELRSNGTILTRYGAGNTNLFPVVGIAGGEPEAYSIPSHTSEQAAISLTNAQQVIFSLRGKVLTVASANPNSGVSITVTPTDNEDLGDGTTQFTRRYNDSTVVNLTAPATMSGNNFLKWQRDGVDWATTAATSVTMDAAHTMTAVYVTPRTLTVASSNPGSDVNITVTPNDNSGAGDGATPFVRTYNDATVVNLTAPATAGGNNFLKWQRDGVDFATTAATSVTMDANRTMTAVYITPRILTVASSNPNSGVNITVTPNDNGALGNGTTQFMRTYNDGTVVNLTAPATAGGNNFLKWQRDGSDWATTLATSVTMDAARTLTAVYVSPRTLNVASSNPNSGVNITVTPNDNGGLNNGTTPFARSYNDAVVVNLTAPASAGGNNFLKWQRDGADWATTLGTSVTIDANRTMTAVYVTPRTLNVASSNPNSGVSITVTPNDNGGLNNGTTPFARTYNDGVVVNSTAPATAGGNNFLKWQRDGVDYATTLLTSITIDANRTMTAVYSLNTRALTVASSNLSVGASITVTPADNGGFSGGTTQFIRTYNESTVVNLTAPATVSGSPFLKWLRDGADFAGNNNVAVSVIMDVNHTMTAVYTPRTLSVASSNPGTGVNITVTPPDNSGLANGATPLARTYNDDTTVNLTAPATAGGNNFLKWQRNGIDFATTAATSVMMDANYTMTAVYITPRTLTVASSNPASGVSITVTPNDNGGLHNGTTQFTRTYNDSTVVNLTAPTMANGNNFLKWQRNGFDFATTLATSVTMSQNWTMTAVYSTPRTLTVTSSNSGGPVNITVTPNDLGGDGNGPTPLVRTYNNGTVVNLTAPATAGGNNFLKWQRDGVDFATTPATSVTMDAARTMMAFYITPRILSVASSNPAAGVGITVTPNDNSLPPAGGGVTPFARTYNEGTVVNLTAPVTAFGNNFLKWVRDGDEFAGNNNPATSVTMDGARTMTAVYITPRILSVASSNPAGGVGITVTPNDNSAAGDGVTAFARTYNDGTVVNLTAPATAFGNNFLKWQRNGADWATTLATSLTMNAAYTMTAVYVTPRALTIASSNPASGVTITVTPADNNSLSNGATPFARTYNDGAVVNLTAPANAADGNPFLKWQRDGVDWATTPGTSLTIDAARTMTAVYSPSLQFTVPQFNVNESDGSVTVTVTRSGPTTAAASVDYTTSDNVATQKGDYIFSAGRLNFAIGEASKSFVVFIIDDVYQDGTETFRVNLSNPVGAPLGARSVSDVAISDNDLTPPTTNPLNNADARFFVREHYLDFLNREPDQSGLDFWANQITSCGTDQGCIEVRRINVSAAFFLSIEFQETGYLVERLYKSSYGQATGTSTLGGTHQLPVPIVRFTEFMADSQEISRGVVIGQAGADQLLENNKQAFIAAFVQRSRFQSAFVSSQSPATFVDQLFLNAGVTPSAGDRQAAIDEFGGAATIADVAAQARALRRVAENSILKLQETNRAFVLMQYFGYMRRNPDDAPEFGLDYTGYDFWLTKLNQFNGNFINAEMVKAFITAGEYRQRFGP